MNPFGERIRHRLWAGAAIAAFGAVIVWFLSSETPGPKDATPSPARLPVSLVETRPTTASVDYRTTGLTRPRWPMDVIAAVEGRVEVLPARLEAGTLLSQGEALVQLMDSVYRSELQSAKAGVAGAQLELSKAEREQAVLKKDAVTAFGRREPHVRAAEASLSAARAVQAAAEQRLRDTVVTAPFAAILIERRVAPGQWIATGDVLFRLAASDSIDVEVELSESLWRRLGDLDGDVRASVTAPSGRQWPATLRYLSPVVDPVSRQRGLILKVANPYQGKPPLLPDQQVSVRFMGPELAHVVSAPATVLTQDGKVWTVQDQRLVLEDIELLDEQPETILLRFSRQPERARALVRYPLGIMLEGQLVAPEPLVASAPLAPSER